MSELGDTFKAWREEKREKKQNNLASSIELLRVRGHDFIQLSEHHLRIGKYDFWPSTGKYLNRETKRGGRGVLNLLCKLEPSKGREP